MKSLFEHTNNLIRKLDCVKLYQGDNARIAASLEHIGTGYHYATLICLFGMISKWFLIAYPVAWLLQAALTEYVFQRKANEGLVSELILAQVVERSIGFVLSLPLAGLVFLF